MGQIECKQCHRANAATEVVIVEASPTCATGADEPGDAYDCVETKSVMSEASTPSDGGTFAPEDWTQQYWTPASTVPHSQAPSMDDLPPMFSAPGQGVLDLSRITPQPSVFVRRKDKKAMPKFWKR